MEDHEPQAPNGAPPALRRGGDPRVFDTVATELVSGIARNWGCQICVHLVRMRARDGRLSTSVSLGRWFRPRKGEDWREDRKPWRGGPLLRPSEIPAVWTRCSGPSSA